MTQAIIVSDWLISKNSSPLKPHGLTDRDKMSKFIEDLP
jgi:hypothetical protein